MGKAKTNGHPNLAGMPPPPDLTVPMPQFGAIAPDAVQQIVVQNFMLTSHVEALTLALAEANRRLSAAAREPVRLAPVEAPVGE